MNPAWSIVAFTTLAGYGQGVATLLAVAQLASTRPEATLLLTALASAEALLVIALAVSFLHLGHKRRAWRAILMWRTSWMSREVIVMPVFMVSVAAWWLAAAFEAPVGWRNALAVAVALLSLLLWLCTGMIYACLRFVQEWAHPFTVVNYILIGISSGAVLLGSLSAALTQTGLATEIAPWALFTTMMALVVRLLTLRRNARLKPKSTLQSATGLKVPHISQHSMGMTGGSYNTREFFHNVTGPALRYIKVGFLLLGFAAPMLMLSVVCFGGSTGFFLVALPVQALGLLAERWFFFAQARHPQNLYYQMLS